MNLIRVPIECKNEQFATDHEKRAEVSKEEEPQELLHVNESECLSFRLWHDQSV